MSIIKRPRKIAICLVSISALALVTYIAVHAQSNNTIQGCYSNGNGSLRRVNSPSDCKQTETPISWNVAGIPGPQGPQGIPGPQGPPGVGSMPLRVVDNVGNEVGVYGDGSLAIRRNESLNTWIALQVSSDGFVQGRSGFGYTTSDCTGTAYSGGASFPQLVDPVYVVGDTVYQPTGSIQMLTLNSSQNFGGPCEVSTFTQEVRPIITYPVSDFGLNPPFTLTR